MEQLAQVFLTSPVPMHVELDPRYPQFMLTEGSDEHLIPMTEQNAAKSVVGLDLDVDVSDSVQTIVGKVRALSERLIAYIRGIISGIVAHAKGTADPVPLPQPAP